MGSGPLDCEEAAVSNNCRWNTLTCSSISTEFILLNAQKGHDIRDVSEAEATVVVEEGGGGGRGWADILSPETLLIVESFCFRRSAEPFNVFANWSLVDVDAFFLVEGCVVVFLILTLV